MRLILLLFSLLGGLQAQELTEAPFLLVLPIADNVATPSWLGHPEMAANTQFAQLDVPVLAPLVGQSLLATFYFQEEQGGFLRLTWKGLKGAQVITDNLYEGIALPNQRSVVLPEELLAGGGTLQIQASGATLNVDKIKLEWLETQPALVSPRATDALVFDDNFRIHFSLDLNGQANVAPSLVWQRKIVSVVLTDTPQRVENGVEYSLQLDQLPRAIRLHLEENSLPVGQRLVVWINQQRAGTITSQAPDLREEGYSFDAAGELTYQGWREGSLLVPLGVWQVGKNTVQFSSETEAAQVTTPPLALKNVTVQLDYGAEPTIPSSSP